MSRDAQISRLLADRLAFAIKAVEEQLDHCLQDNDMEGADYWLGVSRRILSEDPAYEKARTIEREQTIYLRALHFVRGMVRNVFEKDAA